MWIKLGVLAVWAALIFDVEQNGMTGTPSRYALYAALLLLQVGLFLPTLKNRSNAQVFSQEGIEK